MAKARMLHRKISLSSQVNRLSLEARLLFTWMIPYTDDEGRLKGEPEYIKATIVPMTTWSFIRIKKYLDEIKDEGLIYYWQENNEWYIEFCTWEDHQTIRKDRFEKSKLPSFKDNRGNQLTPNSQPLGDGKTPQYNINKVNQIEDKKSEDNKPIADKDSSNSNSLGIINPHGFTPSNEGEFIAYETWKRLEPNNPLAFSTTYYKAYKLKLPPQLFGQFASEIEQDSSIKNRGAVFNNKVQEYLKGGRA